MSQQNSSDPQNEVVQKRRLDVYTVMLIVAFCAMMIATLLLYLELTRWGEFPWWKGGGGAAAAASYTHPAEDVAMPSPHLESAASRVWS